MTNIEKEYSKALDGGIEMLKRAAELDQIALRLKKEVNYNPDNWKFAQALMIGCMADEMRRFYKIMFN